MQNWRIKVFLIYVTAESSKPDLIRFSGLSGFTSWWIAASKPKRYAGEDFRNFPTESTKAFTDTGEKAKRPISKCSKSPSLVCTLWASEIYIGHGHRVSWIGCEKNRKLKKEAREVVYWLLAPPSCSPAAPPPLWQWVSVSSRLTVLECRSSTPLMDETLFHTPLPLPLNASFSLLDSPSFHLTLLWRHQ